MYKNEFKKLLKSYTCLYLTGFVEIFLCLKTKMLLKSSGKYGIIIKM